jgi:hypothetical protein
VAPAQSYGLESAYDLLIRYLGLLISQTAPQQREGAKILTTESTGVHREVHGGNSEALWMFSVELGDLCGRAFVLNPI